MSLGVGVAGDGREAAAARGGAGLSALAGAVARREPRPSVNPSLTQSCGEKALASLNLRA